MNKNKALEISVFIVDLFSLFFCYTLGSYLYLVVISKNQSFFDENYVHMLIYFFVSFIIAQFFTLSKNKLFLSRNRTQEMFNIIKNATTITVVISVLIFLMKNSLYMSRGVLLLTMILFTLVSYPIRICLKKNYKNVFTNGRSKMLIISNHKIIEDNSVFNEIESGLNTKIKGLVIVDEDMTGSKIRGYDVLCSYQNLLSFAQIKTIDEVLLILDNETLESMSFIIDTLQSMGIIVHLGIDSLATDNRCNKTIDYIGNYPVLTYIDVIPHEESLILKRIIDIIGGSIGMILVVISSCVLGPIIKIESQGPVFFTQDRVGKNGRNFKIYKFRSMGVDAEQKKASLLDQNEVDGHMFKMTNDPRVTKVGKFIRATSLDEIPQFINVLKGDMSLVGTRPPTVDEFNNYEAHHKRRLSMKPGITGMWQVSGRSDIMDFEEVVRLDNEYINNYTLALDIKILFKTILVVFSRIGSK